MSTATLEQNTNWTISEDATRNLELYQPRKQKSDSPARNTQAEGPKHVLTGGTASERTFKNRPGDSEDVAFTPIDRIPQRHFYSYYNTLDDRILPQLSLPTQAILSALFRRAHGFNRNWCQMSLPQLERRTGASRNTIRKHLKILIEYGLVCIVSDGYHEATTYGLRIPVDIKEELTEKGGDPPAEPARPPDSNTARSPEVGDQNLLAGGSKSDSQKLPSCTSSTYTEQFTGEIPDSHLQESTPVRIVSTPDPEGENRVTDNQNDKKYRGSLSSTKPDLEESYLKSLPDKKVGEIYRAQDAWNEILGPDTRPTAAKLNQMLQYMRGWYRAENLDVKFRWCLADTKKKRPRDAVAWLISALKHGRYPNIVMSGGVQLRTRSTTPVQQTNRSGDNQGTGNRSAKRSSQLEPNKAPDAEQELDRPRQTSDAIAAEREKRRAASPHRDLWEKVLKNIGEKVHDQSLETWFEPLFITEITETTVVFDAPEQLIADWVGINYTGLLEEELETVGISGRSIVIEHLKT